MKLVPNKAQPNAVGLNSGATHTSSRAASRDHAVALVITLLMLSVITFLAIAFLSMTSRDKTAVTASLDLDTAKTMSDAGLARAEASTIAQMMSAGDILSYDLAVSTNYISPNPYAKDEYYDPANVNYDTIMTNNLGDEDKAWNIADLFWDPRPPVFIQTNGSIPNPQYDFRFWVDVNRNGGFETNGSVHPFQDLNLQGQLGALDYFQGEPEWIGVLKYPETNHGPNNPFIGRYAYMILPIGKTLDWNFIHNYNKALGSRIYGSTGTSQPQDYFIRDQGVGSWELNLAGFLNNLNTNLYFTYAANPYGYSVYPGANSGDCFNDAAQFIGYRYAGNPNNSYPQTIKASLGAVTTSGIIDPIDEFGGYPSLANPPYFDYNNSTYGPVNISKPWPGSYNTNMFYDVQDVFDSTKTGLNVPANQTFSYRFANIMTNKDTYDRYTMQRMLACIGMGSQPEYGTYVYSNSVLVTNFDGNPLVPPPTSLLQPPLLLRTKVNIDFDNSSQIASGPYSPMPTNPLPWTDPLKFFTNAADLLLRSQVFTYTNFVVTNGVGGSGYMQSNYILMTFGITNIPVYVSTNPGIVYNEQVHRLLQLAANIYAAANPAYTRFSPEPPVFRPQFRINTSGVSNTSIYITNFVFQTNGPDLLKQINYGFFELTNSIAATKVDPNFWGVPWVIGAVKGLPAFDQYSYQNQVYFARRLNFIRFPGATAGQYLTSAPKYTNQFYTMSVSNICGLDAWNPYNEDFSGGTGGGPSAVAYYDMTVTITNNYNWGTNIFIANVTSTPTNILLWQKNSFRSFLQSNFVALPTSYYSESTRQMWPVTNVTIPADLAQATYPTHFWTVSVSNHMYYALFDGPNATGNLLDFVNLGPFGSTFPVTQDLINDDYWSGSTFRQWIVTPATDAGTKTISSGVANQILEARSYQQQGTTFEASVLGQSGGYGPSIGSFDAPVLGAPSGQPVSTIGPYGNYTDSNTWAACDPLVHYTVGDLTCPLPQGMGSNIYDVKLPQLPLTLSLGLKTTRYLAGVANGTSGHYILGDTGMTNSDAWNFPTNLFPSVGWIGRVHRGTPWQTVYLKPNDPIVGQGWSSNYNGAQAWVSSQFTYPTNDWVIPDLFTAVPNDNAARGLLSVNNTNDAAWAAVFSGVVVPSNSMVAGVINPWDVPTLMDSTNGINVQARSIYANGNFRHIGDISAAPILTVNSPYLAGGSINTLHDDIVERIPQQTLGLLKVGYPQFVIYSWGQALRPKAVYSGGPSELTGICTNYEITGEFLTRTICHVVSTDGTANAPQIVVDNYNIMPGN